VLDKLNILQTVSNQYHCYRLLTELTITRSEHSISPNQHPQILVKKMSSYTVLIV